MSRSKITPETFASAFMSRPCRSQVHYGEQSAPTALRRELLTVIHEVLRSEIRPGAPILIGGSMLREMVKAKAITLAEAVAEIWEYAEAEAGTDRWIRADDTLRKLVAEDEILEASSPKNPRRAELAEQISDRVHEIAVNILREDDEHEIADLAENYPNTLKMLCDSRPLDREVLDLTDLEHGAPGRLILTD